MFSFMFLMFSSQTSVTMAPKRKGKGKGDKLARMTVEQRQHYLERRAAQEAESNRRKEELVAGFLKVRAGATVVLS